MNKHRQPLYKKDEARCLRDRGTFVRTDVEEKFRLLLENIGSCQRLVDIGCGWGQFLSRVSDQVNELWGVDESPDQVKYVKEACPQAKVVMCRADKLELPDDYFDVAVTSQMLHEVKLFGEESELERVLGEIRRIFVQRGKYLLLDHQDAGEGEVVVRLPKERIRQLVDFERKFKYYPATHEPVDDDTVRISKRCLQDFLSKEWSFGTAMESMEMNETHNVFEQGATIQLLESSGFSVCKWIAFSDIRKDLEQVEGDLLEGEAWCRKFLLVAVKC